MNTVILRGTLSSEPQIRTLSSGATLTSLELTTRTGDGPAASVPVACFDEVPRGLAVGDEVVVVGVVRRRFFRSGGHTQSRTEVVASEVAASRQRRACVRVLQRAVAALATDLGLDPA